MLVPIRNFGGAGVTSPNDAPPEDAPLNGFTSSGSVTFRGRATTKRAGFVPVVLLWPDTMQWFQAWDGGSGLQSVAFCADDTIYTTTDAIHINTVTITAPALTTAAGWQSDVFGKFCVLNNRAQTPKYSSAYNSGTDTWTFADLPGYRGVSAGVSPYTPCTSVREFSNHLVALGVTGNPFTVYISDQGSPEAIPTSWDFSDPTKLARRFPLNSRDGPIIDGGRLGDRFIVYQRRAAVALEYVGGSFVMAARRLPIAIGLANPDAWGEFEGKHIVVTEDSIVIHDGSSVLNPDMNRVRTQFFSELSDRALVKVAIDITHQEAVIYYPTTGAIGGSCNRSLTYSWAANTWSFGNLGCAINRIARAELPATDTVWDAIDTPWDALPGAWLDFDAKPNVSKMYQLRPWTLDEYGTGYYWYRGPPTYLLDNTNAIIFDDNDLPLLVDIATDVYAYPTYAQRDYADLDEVTGDTSHNKIIGSVFLQVRGAGVFDVQFGVSATSRGVVQWADPVGIDLGSDTTTAKVDFNLCGRYVHWKLGAWNRAQNDGWFELVGADIEVSLEGVRG